MPAYTDNSTKGCDMAELVKFSCRGCGKTYAWKREIAGKRVKCKCGQPLTVPAQDPAAAAEPEADNFDDLMALAGGEPAESSAYAAPVSAGGGAAGGSKCPSCGSAVAPG